MAVDDLVTLREAATVEIDRVHGSRFIGDASPVDSEASATALLDAVRAREPGATHHCWAFALAGGRQRSSDDGEPGGTAGPPILRRITGAGMVDVAVVVTRYYGGTNLGTGGLIRAYGACAAAALEAGGQLRRPAMAGFVLVHPYELTAPVETVLAAFDADTVDADFGLEVRRAVRVPLARAEAFVSATVEATAGRVTPTPAAAPV